ncbi:hypothetical protein [Sphingomonas sp.]|jgi:Arc/MetJ-type ribon-helix-helix transcriptional regulator|uniref:hypothetical protein n=1 Tax=Sphingomonas sp. TaxID=28214 RepID=UPI002D7F57E4|nr:hypothetical protein [Sphingomonas sp.]HEU0045764.1 hypothetical protein [Sphingomonas sp.]
MGYEVTIKLGDAESERVSAVTGDLARFRDVDEYVNELIQRDADDAFHRDPAVIAELRAAFAVPDEDMRPFDPEAFIERMRRRHS